MKIELNIKELEAILDLIKVEGLKEKLSNYLKGLTEAKGDIVILNQALAFKDPEKKLFRQRKKHVIEVLQSEANKVAKGDYTPQDKDIAEEFFGQIFSSISSCSPALKEENLEDKKANQSQEERLFEDQICCHSSEKFKPALTHIANQSFARSAKVYLIYAWPDKKYQEPETKVEIFVKNLYKDLKRTGLAPILDKEDNFAGSNLNQFMSKLLKAEYVLILGTELLRKRWLSNKGAFTFEKNLLELKWLNDFSKGYIHHQGTTIIPYVLTGIRETAFPDEILENQDITIHAWRKNNYLKTFISILAVFHRAEKKLIKEAFKELNTSLIISVESLKDPLIFKSEILKFQNPINPDEMEVSEHEKTSYELIKELIAKGHCLAQSDVRFIKIEFDKLDDAKIFTKALLTIGFGNRNDTSRPKKIEPILAALNSNNNSADRFIVELTKDEWSALHQPFASSFLVDSLKNEGITEVESEGSKKLEVKENKNSKEEQLQLEPSNTSVSSISDTTPAHANTQSLTFAIGESDFKNVMEKKGIFVDKSLFIKDIIDDKAAVKLILRPRRFGKTLNMSMLYHFFSNNSTDQVRGYFQQLKIWKEDKRYQQAFAQYPVIFLTFKDIKANNFEEAKKQFINLMSEKFSQYEVSLSQILSANRRNKNFFNNVIDGKLDLVDLKLSLKELTKYLSEHYRKRVIVLIDEYDTPINSSYCYNYYDQMTDLIRGLLGPALKDNSYLEQAIITGILRVAKENIFSGLNNLRIYSLLSNNYASSFGFTVDEVEELIAHNHLKEIFAEVENWYGGYQIGNQNIFNPWSITNFVEDHVKIKPDSKDNKFNFETYWINTAENKMIHDILISFQQDISTKEKFKQLVQNQSVIHHINEHTLMKDIGQDKNTLWDFLLLSGYLSIINTKEAKEGELIIPNNEIYKYYEKLGKQYFFQKENLNYQFKILKKDMVVTLDTALLALFPKEMRIDNLSEIDILRNLERGMPIQKFTPPTVNRLLALLDDSNIKFGLLAILGLSSMEQPQVEVIEALLNFNQEENDIFEMCVKQALKKLGSRDEKCIPILFKHLKAVKARERQKAAEVLILLEKTNDEVIETLKANLKDKNASVRNAAAEALINLDKIGDEVIETLRMNLKEKAFKIRNTAAEALIRLDKVDEEVIEVLRENLKSEDAKVRSATARELIRLDKVNEEVIEALKLNLKDKNSELKSAAIKALVYLEKINNEVIRAVRENLKNEDSEIKNAAAEVLMRLENVNDEVIEALSMNLEDEDFWTRNVLISTLEKLSRNNGQGISALIDRLRAKDGSVRQLAAEALIRLRKISDKVIEALRVNLKDKDSGIRSSAARALGQVEKLSDSVIETLSVNLKDEDAAVRRVTAEALGQIENPSDAVIEALTVNLKDEDSGVRSAAAKALGRVEKVNDKVLKALSATLNDNESKVRSAVVSTLEAFSKNSNAGIPVLAKSLQEKYADVRQAAAEALGRIGKANAEVIEALGVSLKDAEPEVRSASAEALGRIRKVSDKVIEALRVNLKDEDLNVRSATAEALGRIGKATDQVIEALRANLKDEDSAVRNAAAEALVYLGKVSEEVIEVLRGNLKDEASWVRKTAAKVLGRIGKSNDEIIEALIVNLKDEASWVRKTATKALGRIGNSGDAVIEALKQTLKDKSFEVRSAGIEALFLLDQRRDDVVEIVRQNLKDEHPRVRSVAAESLIELEQVEKEEIIEALRCNLKTEDYWLKHVAAVSLKRIDKETEEVINILKQTDTSAEKQIISWEQALKNTHVSVWKKQSIAEFLIRIEQVTEDLISTLQQNLKSENTVLQRLAAKALVKVKSRVSVAQTLEFKADKKIMIEMLSNVSPSSGSFFKNKKEDNNNSNEAKRRKGEDNKPFFLG